jgi:hypothetical protein
MDLIIVDVPKGLLVPTVSDLADVIPPWNQSAESLLKAVFVIAEDYLQDDGAIIVIHSYQVDAKSTILEYCVEYSFETCKEWLYMNRLHFFTSEQNLDCNSLPKYSFCIDASLNCVKLNCLPIV